MTWVKIDDAFPSHPKIDGISDGAFRLHVTALCWSCQWLTDGHIPTERLRALPGYRYKPSHVAELTTQGLWDEADGGYQIHDFLVYQMPAAKVRADRAAAAERMRKRRTPEERTPDVRPNAERTNGEVREKFGDPDPYPSLPPVNTPSLTHSLEAPEAEGGSGYAEEAQPIQTAMDRIDRTLEEICPTDKNRLYGKRRDDLKRLLEEGRDVELAVCAIRQGATNEGAPLRADRAIKALETGRTPTGDGGVPLRPYQAPAWVNDPEPTAEEKAAAAQARAEARAILRNGADG